MRPDDRRARSLINLRPAYFRSRSDAVASIVSMLVETDELADESDQIRGIREINVRHELAEEWIDQKWDPEPIDAAPGQSAGNIAAVRIARLKLISLHGRFRIPCQEAQRYLEHPGRDVRLARCDCDRDSDVAGKTVTERQKLRL